MGFGVLRAPSGLTEACKSSNINSPTVIDYGVDYVFALNIAIGLAIPIAGLVACEFVLRRYAPRPRVE